MVKSIELRYETDTRILSHGKSYVSSDVCSIIIYVFLQLKMPGLYLDTLILSHKFCSMLNILIDLKFQEELQNFMTNNVF